MPQRVRWRSMVVRQKALRAGVGKQQLVILYYSVVFIGVFLVFNEACRVTANGARERGFSFHRRGFNDGFFFFFLEPSRQ